MVELRGLHNLRLQIAHSKQVDWIPTEIKDLYAFIYCNFKKASIQFEIKYSFKVLQLLN